MRLHLRTFSFLSLALLGLLLFSLSHDAQGADLLISSDTTLVADSTYDDVWVDGATLYTDDYRFSCGTLTINASGVLEANSSDIITSGEVILDGYWNGGDGYHWLGSLDVIAGGVLNATSAEMRANGSNIYLQDGTFRHNNGTFITGANNIFYINGVTFCNLTLAAPISCQYSFSIEREFSKVSTGHLRCYGVAMTLTLGDATGSGTIKHNLLEAGKYGLGSVTIQADSSDHPVIVEATQDWFVNANTNDWKFKWCDFATNNIAIDTNSGADTDDVEITLLGDCDFADIVIDPGDALDANGHTMTSDYLECYGTFDGGEGTITHDEGLYIYSGATYTASSGNTTLQDDFTNAAGSTGFEHSSGTLSFDCSATSLDITGDDTEFYDLEKFDNSNALRLNADMIIEHELRNHDTATTTDPPIYIFGTHTFQFGTTSASATVHGYVEQMLSSHTIQAVHADHPVLFYDDIPSLGAVDITLTNVYFYADVETYTHNLVTLGGHCRFWNFSIYNTVGIILSPGATIEFADGGGFNGSIGAIYANGTWDNLCLFTGPDWYIHIDDFSDYWFWYCEFENGTNTGTKYITALGQGSNLIGNWDFVAPVITSENFIEGFVLDKSLSVAYINFTASDMSILHSMGFTITCRDNDTVMATLSWDVASEELIQKTQNLGVDISTWESGSYNISYWAKDAHNKPETKLGKQRAKDLTVVVGGELVSSKHKNKAADIASTTLVFASEASVLEERFTLAFQEVKEAHIKQDVVWLDEEQHFKLIHKVKVGMVTSPNSLSADILGVKMTITAPTIQHLPKSEYLGHFIINEQYFYDCEDFREQGGRVFVYPREETKTQQSYTLIFTHVGWKRNQWIEIDPASGAINEGALVRNWTLAIPPHLVAPTNGSTITNMSPTLTVSVDGYNGTGNVTFYDSLDVEIGNVTGVVNGSQVSFIWSSLNASQSYTWYAVLTVNGTNYTSSQWNFSTPAENATIPTGNDPSGNREAYRGDIDPGFTFIFLVVAISVGATIATGRYIRTPKSTIRHTSMRRNSQ